MAAVSFAEIRKNQVLLGLIDRGNPEGRIPRIEWEAVESQLSFISLRIMRERPGTSPCCMDASWIQGRSRWWPAMVSGRLTYTSKRRVSSVRFTKGQKCRTRLV